ncbi:MAG: tripartite tricarboxylate transporter substrate binding protein [Hyphomicrobiales bacterium]|nr:tripartite tricarboxylate transporter substrate binding protein [Hyphomicrobiales bacterium]
MHKSIRAAFAATIFSVAATTGVLAADKIVDKIHFLIPGGPGGGWDGTARGTGEALTKAGILGQATFENMSGGGGGKAIAHLIEVKDEGMLMVNSTPIVIRSLQKVFPQSFRDLTPIAGTIGDYAAFVVNKDSKIADFKGLLDAYDANPTKVAIGGGSVAGGMDHLVAALVMKKAGADPTKVKYIPYDAGGKAMAGLLSGEIQALSTGFGEAIELARQGEVRILCVTSNAALSASPDTPTCDKAGAPGAEFVNWRGFFAAPGLSDAKKTAYQNSLAAMYSTAEWKTVRDRNGWVDIFNKGDDFVKFLENQEAQIGGLMRELGFL